MQMSRYFRGTIRTRTWLDQILALFVVALLSVQLLGAGHHTDNHVGPTDDCASCVFAHHVPHALPEVDLVPAPCMLLARYRVVQLAIIQAHIVSAFLIPHAQGPPHAVA